MRASRATDSLLPFFVVTVADKAPGGNAQRRDLPPAVFMGIIRIPHGAPPFGGSPLRNESITERSTREAKAVRSIMTTLLPDRGSFTRFPLSTKAEMVMLLPRSATVRVQSLMAARRETISPLRSEIIPAAAARRAKR